MVKGAGIIPKAGDFVRVLVDVTGDPFRAGALATAPPFACLQP